jgi:hypothetical protein
MPFVTAISDNSAMLTNPTWERAAQLVDSVLAARRGFLRLFGPREAILSVHPTAKFGSYVSALAADELAERLLIDESLGLSPVDENLGAADRFPRCVFVGDDLVRRAVTESFHTGRRAADLTWKDPFELWSEAGID